MMLVIRFDIGKWFLIPAATSIGLIFVFGFWYGIGWSSVFFLYLLILFLYTQTYREYRKREQEIKDKLENPPPKKEPEPEDEMRLQCIALQDKIVANDFVDCPVCKTEVKAKNIVRHYDRLHGKKKVVSKRKSNPKTLTHG